MAVPFEGDPVLRALAEVCLAEPRPEAARVAAALVAAPREALAASRAPTVLDAEMRALLAGSTHPAAAAVLAAQDRLPWGTNPVADRVGADFAAICAVATLLGPDGPVVSRTDRLGLFYQRPESYYALHSHLADETYVILAGAAVWTAGADIRSRGPGEAIHHPSLMPHAFRTGPEGLLALWRWSGDIATESYRMLDDPSVRAG